MTYQSKSADQDSDQQTTQEWVDQAKREDAAQWIQRSLQAQEAQDPQSALDYAQRAMDFLPDDPQVHSTMQQGILGLLQNDAFVAFLAETDTNYVVRFRDSRPVAVAKTRVKPEIYPRDHKSPGEHVFGLIRWMLLGLLPSGLGTAILGPIVMYKASELLVATRISPRDLKLAWLTIFIATPLTLLGFIFSLLLLLHVIG